MKMTRVRAGTAIAVALLVVALFAPWLAPRDPSAMDLAHSYAGPSRAHPFGQDPDGADLLSEVIAGSRTSLAVGVSVTAISVAAGVTAGLAAGWFGGAVDGVLSALIDFLLAFPGILLAIAVTAVVPRGGVARVILALSVRGWVGFARLARGQALSLKRREFVEAAVALGGGSGTIVFRHLLPNSLSPLVVEATFAVAGAIRDEAALSFLGLGVEPGTPSWGALLSVGRQYLLVAPHIAVFPGLAILVTVLGFNFLGDGLSDRLQRR